MYGDMENPINSHPLFSASLSSLLKSSPLEDKIKRVSINFSNHLAMTSPFSRLLSKLVFWTRQVGFVSHAAFERSLTTVTVDTFTLW
jgi:hypothetical protein